MRLAFRLVAGAILAAAMASAFADSSIHLTAFPSVSVADGRSTVTITAELRDQNGKPVPDGTRVVFDCPGGEFRESTVTTSGGFAHAVLGQVSIAGVYKITATSLAGDGSPGIMEYEFVGDRSQLSTAKEYIEVVAPGYMQYTVDTKIVGAAAVNQGVAIRYREITVAADDLQINIPTYELRARHAHLKMGGIDKTFAELYLKLNTRQGYGTTTFNVKRADAIVTEGHGIAFVKSTPDGSFTTPPEETRFGLVEIHASGLTPMTVGMSSVFDFEEIGGSPSTISAKKAIIFPHREIQFQKADIYVARSKVMSLPLYDLPLNTATSPLVTDQIVSVNDSQLGINFPYYLSLRPGVTQLVRFRTGEVDGRADYSDEGAFLDYEYNWNKGDDMQGGFAFNGIGRDDWIVEANQYVRFNDRASASLQVSSPTLNSYFGSGNISQQFNGFSASLSATETQTVTGIQYSDQEATAVIEQDPIKVGKLPIRLYPGLTADMSQDGLDNESQSGVGARLRAQTLPLVLDHNTSLSASLQTSYLKGPNELNGIQYLGNVSLTRRIGKGVSLQFSYDYTRDGFNELVLGEHRLSMQAYFNVNRLNLTLFGSRSLDLDRSNLFGDLSYGLSKSWRLISSYTFDKYLGDTYVDYTIGIGYRVGWREVGVIWSEQTQRFGIQLLGAKIY